MIQGLGSGSDGTRRGKTRDKQEATRASLMTPNLCKVLGRTFISAEPEIKKKLSRHGPPRENSPRVGFLCSSSQELEHGGPDCRTTNRVTVAQFYSTDGTGPSAASLCIRLRTRQRQVISNLNVLPMAQPATFQASGSTLPLCSKSGSPFYSCCPLQG